MFDEPDEASGSSCPDPDATFATRDQALEPDRGTPLTYRAAGVLCLLAGLIVLGVGVSSTVAAHPPTTGASQALSAAQDRVAVGALWRTLSATQMFPPWLTSAGARYARESIAPMSSCDVLPSALRARLAAAGCDKVLRATYVDSTSTVVATVGTVVLDGSSQNRADLLDDWPNGGAAQSSGLMPHAMPVPGTPAGGFTDSARTAWRGVVGPYGDYLCFAVAGFTDDRSSTASSRSDSAPPSQAAQALSLTMLDELSPVPEPTSARTPAGRRR